VVVVNPGLHKSDQQGSVPQVILNRHVLKAVVPRLPQRVSHCGPGISAAITNSMTDPVVPGRTKSLKLRRLETRDVAIYRELRLESLKGHPEAFSSSWESETNKPISWWVERLEANMIFGGCVDSSPIAGVAGLRMQDAVKLRHRAILWGMYVRPEARGTGLAAALVQRVVEHARTVVEELCLTVVASNAAACRLYSAAGFKPYGLDRRALKVGSEYYDELLMTLSLSPYPELAPEIGAAARRTRHFSR